MLKIINSISLTVSMVTICEISWGLYTPGDYFANGSILVTPSMIASAIFGSYAGYHLENKFASCALLCLLLISLYFWFFIPSGWWATEPPGM
jgi:uncharacterized membrane protein YfcA